MKEKTKTELIGLTLYTMVAIPWFLCGAGTIYLLLHHCKISGIVDFLLIIIVIVLIIVITTCSYCYVILEDRKSWKRIDRWVKSNSYWRGLEMKECFLKLRK